MPKPLTVWITTNWKILAEFFCDEIQFIVIHTVKAFGIVNKAEIDIFLELSCFFDDTADVGNKELDVTENKLLCYMFSLQMTRIIVTLHPT